MLTIEQYLVDIEGRQAILEIDLIEMVQLQLQFKATAYRIPDKGELVILYSPGENPKLENSIGKVNIEGFEKLILVKDRILSKCTKLVYVTGPYGNYTEIRKDYYQVEIH